MFHTLHSEDLSATVSSLGAELKSLKSLSTGEEFIWQDEPSIWPNSAPILFPIVGRLKDGYFIYEGQRYEMDKHGFAKFSTFDLVREEANAISFVLRSSEETKAVFPFVFELEVSFRLFANTLSVRYDVRNTGADPLFFTIGSHPAFTLPLGDRSLSDYCLRFDQPETLDRYFLEDGILTERPTNDYLRDQDVIPLSASLFDNDALIFKDIRSQRISIEHRERGHRLTLDRGNCPHMGIWAKSGAGYVCLEPWHSFDENPSHDNELANKPGILRLDASECFTTSYGIHL